MMLLASGAVSGGAIGFIVVLALVIAAVLLFRSMSRHLRKVPSTFDPPADDAQPGKQPPPTGPGDTPDDQA